jgi:molybdopterin molybdotransferase
MAAAREAGAEPISMGMARDDEIVQRERMRAAFDAADVVITSGGVSVGSRDLIKPLLEELGTVHFGRIALRPGKPLTFATVGSKLAFGLPGNPVSAFVTFLLLVRPALLRWQGTRDVALPSYPGVVAAPLANPGGRRHFIRVRVEAGGKIFSAGRQASHALASLAAASGLVDLAPGVTLPPGTSTTVWRWD